MQYEIIIMRLTILFLFLFSSTCFAEVENSIDERMKTCLQIKSHQTTAGMNNCVITAKKSWDKELNKTYQKLFAELTDEGKKKLELSQNQWIIQKDLQFSFLNEMYNRKKFSGSMYSNIRNMEQLSIIKNRVLELHNYINQHKVAG